MKIIYIFRNFTSRVWSLLNFCNNYFKMVHKAAYDVKLGNGHKILSP